MRKFFLVVFFSLSFTNVRGQNPDLTFTEFWTSFHKSIVSRDYEALSKMTTFPLKAKGNLDFDTIDAYGIKDFERVMSKFFSTEVNTWGGRTITHYDILKSYKLEPLNKNETWIRIDDMEFRKVGGKWSLTLIYDGHTNY